MSGRVWGVLLLVVALAATAVGAGIRAHTVVGMARSVPPPGPPAVGDCLSEPAPSTTWGWQVDSNQSVEIHHPDYPDGSFSRCAGGRWGEVVDVIADPSPVTTHRSDTAFEVSDPTSERCTRAARDYLGTGAATGPGEFAAPQLGAPMLLGPNERQKSAGQHWVACVVTAQDHNNVPVALPLAAKGMWKTGADHDELGTCQILVHWSDGAEPGLCGERHRTELLGYADPSHGPLPTRTELEANCLDLVQRVTGLADVAASGKLLVSMHVFDGGSSLDTGRTPTADSLIVCGVETVGANALTHSLIAWGHHPLPLA